MWLGLFIPSYEIHTARRLETGQNLVLHDRKLRDSQLAARRHQAQTQPSHPTPKPGDTITSLSQQPKHVARDMYLVTAATPSSVTAQKILHPVSNAPTKIMSKTYTTHPKHTRILFSPSPVHLPKSQEPVSPLPSPTANKPWSPTPQAFWDSDSEEDDSEDGPAPRPPPAPQNPAPV